MALLQTGAPGPFPDKQPYIPKLTYRTNSMKVYNNRDSRITIAPSTFSSATPSTVPTSPQFSLSTTPSSSRLPSNTVSPTSGRFPAEAMSPRSSNLPSPARRGSDAPKKEKKGGSFFSFLSVKEPSAQAFEDYQNQMKKKTQGQKKGRPTPVGLPGVSSAKLPPTVPKVNTKWDGVPQALKEKAKEIEKSKNPYRLSVSAGSTKAAPPVRPANLSRTGTSHSASSTGSGNRLAEIYGWSTPNSSDGSIAKDFALQHNKPKKTPSTTTLPETTLFPTHPRLPPRSVSDRPLSAAELPDSIPPVPELPFSPAPYPELSPDSSLVPELPAEPAPMPELPANPIPFRKKPQGPSLDLTPFMRRSQSTSVDEIVSPITPIQTSMTVLPPPRNPLRPPPVPELEGDLITSLNPPAYQQAPLPSPAEYSPVTPSGPPASSPLVMTPDYEKGPLDGDVIKQTIVEVPTTSDEVVIISSGVNILGPPAAARRKPQSQRPQLSRQAFLAGEAEEMTLPQESTPMPPSILKKHPSVRTTQSPARPMLPSYFGTPSPSPSKDLVPGGATLRDRLGWGTGSKSLSPHALPENQPNSPKDTERNITPTPESGNGGTLRKKRGLAMFHRKETIETQ